MVDLIIHVVPFVLYMLCGLKVADKLLSGDALWEIIRTHVELQDMPRKEVIVVVTIWSVIMWPVMCLLKLIKWFRKRKK